MSGPKSKYAYTSDDGSTYGIMLDDSNALAGGMTEDPEAPNLPTGYHPRYVLATHPTRGDQKRIVIGDPGNAIFVGPGGTTMSLVDSFTQPSAVVAYTVNSRVGEKRYNR